ncbi:MAG: ABC transporter ATP-binding protein [bacterium]|nr:ABC transporter ATP-binding protein [bacterium]
MNADHLRVNDLTFAHGKAAPIFENLNLAVAPGETIGVIGPSGCGKSTLLALLGGHLSPTAGSISGPERRLTVHQKDGLFPWLTAAGNVGLGIRDRTDRDEVVRRWIKAVHLDGSEHLYPHQLSGGMRQRAEIARALCAGADVLLMDEPFSALDYQTRIVIRGEILALLAEHPITMIYVTHDIEDALQLADRIIVLAGRPARITCELNISAPHPRDPMDPALARASREILAALLPSSLDRSSQPGRTP